MGKQDAATVGRASERAVASRRTPGELDRAHPAAARQNVGVTRAFPVPVALAASLAVLAGCAVTPPALPAAVPASAVDARAARSDDALAALVDATRPGCSAAVGVRGEVVWAAAAGLADVESAAPLTVGTRFEMASVAKQFTATAVLLLQREGVLSLEDAVAEHVDGLPEWGRTVTLDELMHHTSRIPDYWIRLEADGFGWSDPVSHAQTVDAVRRIEALEPGEGYAYSNSNYVLLAEVVHRVSGVPLPDFLRERLFEPLGLDLDPTPLLAAPDVALSYGADDVLLSPGWEAFGPMGIVATPSELARWGDQYRSGDVIRDDHADGAVAQPSGELYGAGIDLETNGRLNHDGRFGGHVSAFTVSADRETTIVVMCNGIDAPRRDLDAALWRIWDPARDAPPEEVDG